MMHYEGLTIQPIKVTDDAQDVLLRLVSNDISSVLGEL